MIENKSVDLLDEVVVSNDDSSSQEDSAVVGNPSTVGFSSKTNSKGERVWKIKEYENLKKALNDTNVYYDSLQSRKERFYEIDGSLYKPNVFCGPIADDCHEKGYVPLNGYMISIMKDVKYIYEWFEDYIKACHILEDNTQTTKEVTINDYSDKISVKHVYEETHVSSNN